MVKLCSWFQQPGPDWSNHSKSILILSIWLSDGCTQYFIINKLLECSCFHFLYYIITGIMACNEWMRYMRYFYIVYYMKYTADKRRRYQGVSWWLHDSWRVNESSYYFHLFRTQKKLWQDAMRPMRESCEAVFFKRWWKFNHS